MEVRFETDSPTCRSCGRDLDPDATRGGRRPPAPIETGFMDFRGLPEPPRDHRAPWRT